MKTSILFYTNNLLSAQLLTHTVEAVLEHGVNTDSEVVMISHQPLLADHISTQVDPLPLMPFKNIDPQKTQMDATGLYKHVSPLCIPSKGNCVNHVVGQLPYNPTTIIQQLDLGSRACNGDAIILMEHDCLYPSDYVAACRRVLEDHDVSRCVLRRAYATPEGFLRYRAFYLNGVGMRIEPFRTYLRNKRRCLLKRHSISYLEPHVQGLDVAPDGYTADSYGDIDGILPEGQDILDIQHGLNYYQCFHPNKHMSQLFQYHPYWGESESYIDLIESTNLSKKEKMLCFSGVQELLL